MQNTLPIEISAIDARRAFGSILNRAYYRGESFIVKRDKLPMVKITPVIDEEAKEEARKRLNEFINRVRNQLSKHDPAVVDAVFEEAIMEAKKQTAQEL